MTTKTRVLIAGAAPASGDAADDGLLEPASPRWTYDDGSFAE